MRPTWVPFTPWTTMSDYREILEFVSGQGLVTHVDPVQYSIRLLVPPGSLLENHAEFMPHRGELDGEAWSWNWTHPDPDMDVLQRDVADLVESAAGAGHSAGETFVRVTELAGVSLTPDQVAATISARAAPRLTEDWFC